MPKYNSELVRLKMDYRTGSLLTFFTVIICVGHANGARILGMFPLNGKSHFIMFQEIMKSLADKGHQIDVLSPFPQTKPYPNYTDLSIAGSVPVVVNNVPFKFMQSFAKASQGDFINVTGTQICNYLKLPQLQELIRNPPSDPSYDLVIVELFYANCYLAFGRHLNVPIVALMSSPMLAYTNEPLGNPLNTAYVPEIDNGSTDHMNFWQRFKNTIVTWFKCYQSRYYTRGQTDVVKKYFGPDMPDIRELERDVALLLVNSHHTLNGIRPMTPAVVEVGGLHARDDGTELPSDMKKWLDDNKDGFIYVSFGSMVQIETFPNKTLSELYAAFSKIRPIRVLMKVAKPESLPPGLPDNVFTCSWIPQIKILQHENIRAFVTHGGLMGIQEAVTFGVPLIGIPLFRDQPVNIKNCVDKGTAVSLDYKDLTGEKLVAAVNTIVHNPKYKKNMMELSTRFLDRPMKALDTAVFWIEYILKHGGDSLRSPAVKLTWWQLALLDVYASIMAIVLLALYFMKKIFSTFYARVVYTQRRLPPAKKIN